MPPKCPTQSHPAPLSLHSACAAQELEQRERTLREQHERDEREWHEHLQERAKEVRESEGRRSSATLDRPTTQNNDRKRTDTT